VRRRGQQESKKKNDCESRKTTVVLIEEFWILYIDAGATIKKNKLDFEPQERDRLLLYLILFYVTIF
jgi:hypothetical protein